ARRADAPAVDVGEHERGEPASAIRHRHAHLAAVYASLLEDAALLEGEPARADARSPHLNGDRSARGDAPARRRDRELALGAEWQRSEDLHRGRTGARSACPSVELALGRRAADEDLGARERDAPWLGEARVERDALVPRVR